MVITTLTPSSHLGGQHPHHMRHPMADGLRFHLRVQTQPAESVQDVLRGLPAAVGPELIKLVAFFNSP